MEFEVDLDRGICGVRGVRGSCCELEPGKPVTGTGLQGVHGVLGVLGTGLEAGKGISKYVEGCMYLLGVSAPDFSLSSPP